MKVSVLFFASAREAAGISSAIYEISDGSTTLDLANQLMNTYPKLKFEEDQISLAVNKKYCRSPIDLNDGDEIALLPPISGG